MTHTLINETTVDGGCEHAYQAAPCAWGDEPEPLVRALADHLPLTGAAVLDAGCGEGRNALFLARAGAAVTAVDVSELALAHARSFWPDADRVTWGVADVTTAVPPGPFDIVVCDSVLHWVNDLAQARQTVRTLQAATRPGGFHVICAFNDRAQELDHHRFPPRLLARHEEYLSLYAGWTLLRVEDIDITSSHADTPQPHNHSITKFIAVHR